nr:hypothetical protein [Tanacetum cinerariifolium]
HLKVNKDDKRKGNVHDIQNRLGKLNVNLARAIKVKQVDDHDNDLDTLDLENRIKKLEEDFGRLLKAKKAKEAIVKDYTKLVLTDGMVDYVLEKYGNKWKCEDEIAYVILEYLWLKYGKDDKGKRKEAEHDYLEVNKGYVMPKYGKTNWMKDDSWTAIIWDDVYDTFYRDKEAET